MDLNHSLKNWVIEHGGLLPRIEIDEGDDGYFIIAIEAIEAGELIMKIPSGLSITHFTGLFKNFDLSPREKAIANVAHEKKLQKVTFFKPYTDSMHDLEYYRDFPLSSKNYGEWVHISTDFTRIVSSMDDELRSIAKKLLRLPNYKFTFEEIQHAFYIYTTRLINHCLIPVMDLIHYSANPTCRYHCDGKNHCLYATTAHAPGDLVYMKYSITSVYTLLAEYNIVDDDPVVYFRVELKKKELTKLQLAELGIIRQKHAEMPNFFTEDATPNKLLQWIYRVAFLTDKDIEILKKDNEDYYKSVLSKRNEQSVINTIYCIVLDLKRTLCVDSDEYKTWLTSKRFKDPISIKLIKVCIDMERVLNNNLLALRRSKRAWSRK